MLENGRSARNHTQTHVWPNQYFFSPAGYHRIFTGFALVNNWLLPSMLGYDSEGRREGYYLAITRVANNLHNQWQTSNHIVACEEYGRLQVGMARYVIRLDTYHRCRRTYHAHIRDTYGLARG